jgi:hypothetical protein
MMETYTLEPVCEHCRMEPEPFTKSDFDVITECLPAFWGERDPVELHTPCSFTSSATAPS